MSATKVTRIPIKSAAKWIGISEHTLRTYARTERIAHFKIGGRYSFSEQQLEQFLAANAHPAKVAA